MTHKLYMPLIRTPGIGTPPTPLPEPVPELHAPDYCGMNAQELAVYELLLSHPGQRRRNIRCDARLAAAARAKAEDMGRLNFFSHTDPDGVAPNQLARRFGYPLPEHYPDTANGIESIGGGYTRAVDAFEGWLASPGHRAHVLGLNSFFAGQGVVGVGHALVEGSPYGHYWCLLTAPG